MIPPEELRSWSDFLDFQIATFEDDIIAKTGKPHVPDETNVAFLQVDDSLVKPGVERAIDSFIETAVWPSLNYNEALNLVHRASAARGLLLACLNGQMRPDRLAVKPPKPADYRRFVQWLLVDLWNARGKAYIKALTEHWLREHRAPPLKTPVRPAS